MGTRKEIFWAVLSDEQMSNGYPFSLLNDEQMSNKVGVKHQPVFFSPFFGENFFVDFQHVGLVILMGKTPWPSKVGWANCTMTSFCWVSA